MPFPDFDKLTVYSPLKISNNLQKLELFRIVRAKMMLHFLNFRIFIITRKFKFSFRLENLWLLFFSNIMNVTGITGRLRSWNRCVLRLLSAFEKVVQSLSSRKERCSFPHATKWVVPNAVWFTYARMRHEQSLHRDVHALIKLHVWRILKMKLSAYNYTR